MDEYAMERRLYQLSPALSHSFQNVVLVMQGILEKVESSFPYFTDHSMRHALLVMEYTNQLMGEENLKKLNADELYILMCAAYTHDFGMSINEKIYRRLAPGIVPEDYFIRHPQADYTDAIRSFHNEFSMVLVQEYAPLLEFPSSAHAYAVAQVSRGHRKVDLFNEKEFDSAFLLPNGNTVCLPYLAALVRLADETDVGIDRNPLSSYGEHWDNLNWRTHYAIKHVAVGEDGLYADLQSSDPEVLAFAEETLRKLEATLLYCGDVIRERTPYTLSQRHIFTRKQIVSPESICVYETDVGTDDAMALALLPQMGKQAPDYIVGTPGNASPEQVMKNLKLLRRLFGFDAVLVSGLPPEEVENPGEKSTFHGIDGLGGITKDHPAAQQLALQKEEKECSLKLLEERLMQQDKITYIVTSPPAALAYLLQNPVLKDHFSRILVMGGGIREFNCSHETEFNFSKAPLAVNALFSAGVPITLFPLDLTNHQLLSREEIDAMEQDGFPGEVITLLRQNLASNRAYNSIDGAVLHDTLPILYTLCPERFTSSAYRLSADQWGHIFPSPEGVPVTVVTDVDKGIIAEYLYKAFHGGK